MSRSPRRAPATPRRPRVPPVLTRGSERFEGLPILDEFTDDLGLLLWRSLRNVLTWARTPAGQRADLFAGAAAPIREGDLARLSPDPELQAPLSVILALLERPEEADVTRLSNACRRVSLWAEERGSLATALDYAQAAALVAPGVALLAYHVGRLARRQADYDRAEGWFLRAIIQGRQQKEWRAYTLAFSGMGNLFVQKGNFPEARRFHQRCLRAAVRHSLHELEGDSAHDLFGIAIETEDWITAEKYARQAFQAYGDNYRKIPRLAKDVAYLWLRQGYFARALNVTLALLPHFSSPDGRLLVLADIARAAGGAGDHDTHQWAAAETWIIESQETAPDIIARGLLDVAHGAASLKEWAAAERTASRALDIAVTRKEGKVIVEAESVLAFIRGCRPTQTAPAVAQDGSGDELATQFVRVLQGQSELAAC